MKGLRALGARVNEALDAWSAKSPILNVVLSTGRTVAVGVKLLVRDTRQVLRDSGAPVETYAMAERRHRVKRDLLIGLPFAIYFNIPIGSVSCLFSCCAHVPTNSGQFVFADCNFRAWSAANYVAIA
jgi:hypothetical protein